MSDKINVRKIRNWKDKHNEPIVAITAYDHSMAHWVDQANVDIILVGDSLGNVIQGHDTTLPVTLDHVIYHLQAVTRTTKQALIVGDMPFLTFQISPSETVRNAGRMIQEGKAEAVKIEGGRRVGDAIKAVLNADIPVMGHLGMTPQSIHQFGGYRYQGRGTEADKILDDALFLQDLGCFAIVLELIPEPIAERITQQLSIPTIGIGAGRKCKGQIIVLHDILGLYPGFSAAFVKKYAEIGNQIQTAVSLYATEVREGKYPDEAHTKMD